jgi:hypothetical protein
VPSAPNLAVRRFARVWRLSLALRFAALFLLLLLILKVVGGL